MSVAIITGYYQTILRRTPSDAEVASWNTVVQGGGLTLEQVRNAFLTSTENTNIVDPIIRLYQSAFNRQPDSAGLDHWVNIARSGTSITQIATLFSSQTEFTNRYGTDTGVSSAYVISLYNNVLGRTATNAEISSWTSSGLSRGAILRGFSDSPEAVTRFETSINTLLDGVAQGTSTLTPTQPLGGTTSVTPGLSFTLTTGADAGTSFTGGANSDTFNGVIGTNSLAANGTTFNAGDNLTGGAGTDTVNISVSGTHTAGQTHASFVLSGIETVLVTNFETSANNDTFDMGGATGVTTVGTSNSSATGDVYFTNVSAVVASQMRGGGDLSVTYTSSLLTGTADSVSLTLNGAGTEAASADFETWNGAAAGVAETLSITSQTAANFVTINGNNDHKTINVAGSQNLSITNTLDTTVTKVDATSFTGVLKATLGASSIEVIGGSGNDRINTADTLATADTLNGGAGTDTIAISDADKLTTATGARVTNFEILEATAGDATTYDYGAIAGLTTFITTHTSNDTVTVSNLGASTAIQINAGAGDDENLTGTLATNTTADTASVTIGPASSTTATGIVFGTLTLANHETIGITSNGGTSAAANSIAVLTAAAATKLTVAGDRDLNLKAFTNSNVLTSLDASTFTGKLDMDAALAGSGAHTLTGGTGNDTLIGGTGNDSISGGAGNDDITGGTGNNTLNGDAGNDTLTGGAGNDVINGGDGNDSIVGAAGNDNLSGGAGNDTIEFGTFANLTLNDTVSGGDGTDTLKFSEDAAHNFTTDTTILQNVSGIERYEFSAINGRTVTINDVNVSAGGGSLTLSTSSNNANTFDVSGVLSNSSKIVFSATSAVTAAQTYVVGNGIDDVTLTTANDTVTVSTAAYLGASDTIRGGAGTGDTIAFTQQVTSTTTITAAQLAALTGFETMSFDTNGGAAGTGNYAVTLTDTFLASNNNAGQFTASRGSVATTPDTGTLSVVATDVTSAYKLTLSGASGNDTLTGGAGNDTLTGGLGTDSLTGGAGNDTFIYSASSQAALGEVIAGGDGTDVLSFVNTAAQSNSFIGTTISGIETISIDRTAGGASTTDITFSSSVLSATKITVSMGANTGSADDIRIIVDGTGSTIDLSQLSVADTDWVGAAVAAQADRNDHVVVNGTSSSEAIIGTAGTDVITGGQGGDTINLGAGDDVIVYSTVNDGAAQGATTGSDTITGFAHTAAAGGDAIGIAGTLLSLVDDGGNGAIAVAVRAGGGTDEDTDEASVITTATTSLTDLAGVATTIGAVANSATGNDVLFLVNNGADTGIYFYVENGTAANAVSASELTLLGIISGAVVTTGATAADIFALA